VTPGPRMEPRAAVPHSAWSRLRARFRPPRRLKLTREGRFFILITFFVGFAAINTGNNLLYLMLGLLLSLIIVSGVLSELSLRQLTVVRRLPPRAQVGRPHLVEIEVFNHKQKLPSYAIEVEDLRLGHPADKRCFFLKISPGSLQVAAYRRTPGRRGPDYHQGFRIATRFPFGLFEKSREVASEGTLLVYPAVDPLRLPPPPSGNGELGSRPEGVGRGDEVFGIRPMREGEDPRDIYWKRSVLPNQFVLRERSNNQRRVAEFELDCMGPGDTADEGSLQRFEQSVREVASRAVAELRRGSDVLVRTNMGTSARTTPSRGADPILRFLALVEPLPSNGPASATRSEKQPPALPAAVSRAPFVSEVA
jgi:uncharacterized protein (DUF58 family)